MRKNRMGGKLPRITVSSTEQDRLLELAIAIRHRLPEVAETIENEMDRAEVIERGPMPANVIRMGSSLVYRDDHDEERAVTLVYPDQADIMAGRISILTPIGVALIGLSEGQSIRWTSPNGREHGLTVVKVSNSA